MRGLIDISDGRGLCQRERQREGDVRLDEGAAPVAGSGQRKGEGRWPVGKEVRGRAWWRRTQSSWKREHG